MVIEAAPPVKKSLRKIPFMDGLRGLAALYVVLGHIVGQEVGTHPVLHPYLTWVWHAIYAVDIFIVLSGFLLMLPVAHSVQRQLEGGLAGFWSRRAWRILPAYFAALLASILYVDWAYLQAHPGVALRAGDLVRLAGPGAVLSHLLLLHNLRPNWAQAIDGPMWSVAMEWQIYFLFALLLLPVWRKWGIGAALVTAFALGLAPHVLLPQSRNLDWTCPWFLGLFSLGMAGAVVSVAGWSEGADRPARVPWGRVALLLFGALVLARPYIHSQDNFLTKDWGQIGADVLMGAATACFLIYGARVTLSGAASGPLVLRLLDSRFPMALGRMSYSLYLIHYPITWEVLQWTVRWRLAPGAALFVHLLLGVSLSLLAASAFSAVFEVSVRRRARAMFYGRLSAV